MYDPNLTGRVAVHDCIRVLCRRYGQPVAAAEVHSFLVKSGVTAVRY